MFDGSFMSPCSLYVWGGMSTHWTSLFNRPYTQKRAIANLAKGRAFARQVKGLVIALVIVQKTYT